MRDWPRGWIGWWGGKVGRGSSPMGHSAPLDHIMFACEGCLVGKVVGFGCVEMKGGGW